MVTFSLPGGDRVYTATPLADRTWSIEPDLPPNVAPAIHGRLTRIAEDYRGPSDGRFGPRQLREAAAFLGGEATIEPTGSHFEDVVY